MSNIVAIVGRPNVGKSTLFNRLTKQRQAIVDAVSGVTRDRHYGKSDWNGKEFSVIDTGGWSEGSDDVFENDIRKQAQVAIDEASVIIFVVNVEDGTTPLDRTVAEMLRKVKKPVFLVVNKVDNNARIADAVEFYELGIGEYFTISSINGSGTGELLDAVVAVFDDEEYVDEELPRFAVVGRPNAGKSSFINALLGVDRTIVTEIAGTTRDTINTKYNRFGFEFNLVDTAGIRKKGKVKEDLEFYSVMRAVRAVENADVVLLIIDASRGLEAQDENIFWLAHRNRKGIVILLNKWDLIEKNHQTIAAFQASIKAKLAPFSDVPIEFVSALTKQRIFKAIETAVEVFHHRKQKIPTRKLNDTMLEILKHTPPPSTKGKFMSIKFCMQLPTHAPQFAFFANLPQYIKEPYKRFVENQLREHFDFTGVPISIYFRKK